MNKEAKIAVFSLIVLVGFFVAVVFHYIGAVYLGFSYPLNTFLFIPHQQFSDYAAVYEGIRTLNPYPISLPGGVYFPFLYLMLHFMKVHGYWHDLIFLYLLFFASLIYFTYHYCWQKTNSIAVKARNYTNLFIIIFLSYPLLFSVERGNVELILFIITLAAIYFYQHGKYALSVTFLSFAIASKLFPAVFLLLFIADKKYKEVVYAILFTLVITLIALLSFHTSISTSLQFLKSNLAWFQGYFVAQHYGAAFNSSLFGALKVIARIWNDTPYSVLTSVHSMKLYIFIALPMAVSLSAYVVFIEKEFWKQVTIITGMMLLLPYVSSDYKLLNLYIPLFIFFNAKDKTKESTGMFYTIIFALLFIPKNYALIYGPISIAVLLNTGLLLLLVFSIMTQRLFTKN